MPQPILEGSADAVRRVNRGSMRLLGLVARVHPDERREASGAFLTLFGFMTGHALLETARDALFLASIPARRLPWVYLAIAVLALAIGQREPRVVRQISGRNELGRWLLVAAAVTGAFGVLVSPERVWLFYALYVWSGVLASLVVVRFWTVLGGRFTLTQAKRLFPVVGSGSVAGAITGSALARGLSEVVAPGQLVLAAAMAFAAAAAAPALLGADDPAPRTTPEAGEVARQIWGGRYLRRVLALVLLATVTFTLVDFVFKSAAARLVAAESLDEFFSSVYLSVNVLSLLVQVGLLGWLVRHFGVASLIAVAPAAMMISTLGFAVGGGLTLALALKGTDGALRHSLHRTGTELLFVPLAQRVRPVKGMIDVLGQRGGQAVASILILMLLSTTGQETVFAALACLTAAAWLAVAIGLREHYLDLFRETLQEETGGRRHPFPALDIASLESLLDTLNSPDERRVLAALEVLHAQGKAALVPALLLYHPSPDVVVRALDLFVEAGRQDALAMMDRLEGHPDPRVRAAGLRAHTVLAPDPGVLRRARADPDRAVAVTAEALLVAGGWEGTGEVPAVLTEAARSGPPAARRDLALALAARPHPVFEPVIGLLLSAPETEVLRAAIGAARALGSPDLVAHVIPLLAKRAVREEVRDALAWYGPSALTGLQAALDDPALAHGVRRHVPGAIALIGSARAPYILLRHLEREPDGMIRFKVLRALGRWRARQPHLPLDQDLLQRALGSALSTGFRLMGWRHVLEDGAAADAGLETELQAVLVKLLADKQDHALERVFRLLNLHTGNEEFQRIFRGLHSPHGPTRAGSRELLAHMVLPPVRKPLLTLVDDLHGEARVHGASGPGEHDSDLYAEVLSEIIECGMESASAIAARHAAESGLWRARRALGDARPVSEEHRLTLERARAQLAGRVQP